MGVEAKGVNLMEFNQVLWVNKPQVTGEEEAVWVRRFTEVVAVGTIQSFASQTHPF